LVLAPGDTSIYSLLEIGMAAGDSQVLHNTFVLTNPATFGDVVMRFQGLFAGNVVNNILAVYPTAGSIGIYLNGGEPSSLVPLVQNNLILTTGLLLQHTGLNGDFLDAGLLNGTTWADGNVDNSTVLELILNDTVAITSPRWYAPDPVMDNQLLFGVDITGSIPTDSEGTIRTVPVTVGAYEM
jgi:hypothetical protein